MASSNGLKLYSYWRSSCSYRVRIALNLKNIPYQYCPINLLTREQYQPEFLKINPHGRVPCLVTASGDIIAQSAAILEYLEETNPNATPLLPSDPVNRARAREIFQSIAADIQPLHGPQVMKRVMEEDHQSWIAHFISTGLEGKSADP
jgi:maleylacetoacetate isomerase